MAKTYNVGKNRPGSNNRSFVIVTGDTLVADDLAGYNVHLYATGCGGVATLLQTSYDQGANWATFREVAAGSGYWDVDLGACHYLKVVNANAGFKVLVVLQVPCA